MSWRRCPPRNSYPTGTRSSGGWPSLAAPTETVIDVPGVRTATAEVMFGDGQAQIQAGKLSASFDAIESRVYRIRPEQISARYPQE